MNVFIVLLVICLDSRPYAIQTFGNALIFMQAMIDYLIKYNKPYVVDQLLTVLHVTCPISALLVTMTAKYR